MSKPMVAVIGTGGTIAGVADTRLDFLVYKGGRHKVEELLEDLRPELGALAEVTAEEFRGSTPPGLKLADYHELTGRVNALLGDVDAVVVTSGTQLLEELAYWLDLTVRDVGKPVVITGSMRPWNVLGSDAPVNLFQAIRLAASGRTAGFGPVVLANDEVFTARDVTKTNALRLHALRSRQHGILGAVDGEHIRLLRAPARPVTGESEAPFDMAAIDRGRLPLVEIACTYVDAAPSTISGLVDGGAVGVVVAGEPSSGQIAAIRDGLSRGVLFVAANRNGSGAVYGSGMPGVLPAEDLLPQKARILLVLSLAVGQDVDSASRLFNRYSAPRF